MAFLDWWVPDGPLPDGETERLGVLANLRSSRWRALGGRLIATERRLIFRPNRVDRALGARVWSVAFIAIREVGRRGPTGNPFDGGLRTRLRVVTADGEEHLFVVNGLARVVEQVRGLVSAAA